MNPYVEWARANVSNAADLSDTDLLAVANEAWRTYRRAYVVLAIVLLWVYSDYLADPLVEALYVLPSFWHRMITGMVVCGAAGGLLYLPFRTAGRRQMRESIDSQ